MARGLKPSTMKAAHIFENNFQNMLWIIVSATIAVGGYMLYSGKSLSDLQSDVQIEGGPVVEADK